MSDNPYTMNSLGPVWQQGYEAGQAALQSQLKRMPCGHRRCDWVTCGPTDVDPMERTMPVVSYCLSCRAVQEAVEAERLKCIDVMWKAEMDHRSKADAIRSIGPAIALAEALRRAREEVLVEAAKANCPICADGEGVHQIDAEFYHGTLKCESGSIHLLRSKLEGR